MTKETEMRKHYDNFLVSGLTRKVYCEKHNINIHTFKYWQCKESIKKCGANDFNVLNQRANEVR